MEGLRYLEERGFEILSVTIDGRRGIKSVFSDYPVQICQFQPEVQTGLVPVDLRVHDTYRRE